MGSTITDRLYGENSSVAVKAPVVAASNGPLLLNGLTPVGSYQTSIGDRILVKDQTDPSTNGIYNASVSAWKRTGDFDGPNDCVEGTLVIALVGVNQGLLFQLVTEDPIIGASPLAFVPIWQPANVAYPIIPAEILTGVPIVNGNLVPGDVARYGGDELGIKDASNAWLSALQVSAQSSGGVAAFVESGNSFKILNGAAVAGQITILGEGKRSKLLSDLTVVTVTNGTNSVCSNLWMENITAPWTIKRDPTNWFANALATLTQSNDILGYQPTVNDGDVWPSLTLAQQTQNIGPVLYFTGAASGIEVSKIYGRFVRVEIRDAIDSTIRDCNIRGGKGVWGALAFDNWQNGVQRGVGNRIINNRVSYGSFSGCYFASNDDFTCGGNQVSRCGESGTKTLQCQGVNFTATLAVGATTATIAVPNAGLANGTWNFVFQGGEQRAVTITGGTACAWAGGLVVAGYAASAYQSALNPQCFRGQIENNRVYQNYYDGLDCASTFTTTADAARTYHQVNNNYSYNNGGDGLNADGQFNTYVGNKLIGNGAFGFWGVCSFSLIEGNHCIGNSVNGEATFDLLGGIQGNSIVGNRVVYTGAGGPGTTAFYASQSPGVKPHVITDNVTVGATSFFGNPGQIIPVLSNNVDETTGSRTFVGGLLIIRNAAGTLQHAFANDVTGAASANLSKVIGNIAAFTATQSNTFVSSAGACLSTVDTNGIVLNTAAQYAPEVFLSASCVKNSTGNALPSVSVSYESLTIDGVTSVRPVFRFWNPTSGAGIVLSTSTIPAGDSMQVAFNGYLS